MILLTLIGKKYKEKHGEQSKIKETFILFTDSAFDELTEHQKKDCTKYNYSRNDIKDGFYCLPFSAIEREKRISNFLEKINQSKGDYSGALIDKIFVPPDEFDELKEKLEKDKIIFITGTAGYGKTYTTIRLLWEWYNKGYAPEWIAGKEPKHREEVREKLANIETILKPYSIIYFEDPFGKIKYERRDDLKERINSIINSVKNKKNVYVVITSRKDVFEQFEKESYSVEEINNFEKELNILKPSYNYNKRKEILKKWAEEKECEWLKSDRLRNIVFYHLEAEGVLPTPLSIHDFTEATVNVKDEIFLKQKIDAYSRAVEKAVADEIKGLYDSGRADRVLFLSFIFISEYFDVDFIKQEYEKLKNRDFEDFEKILEQEYRVKIRELWMDRKKKLEFSHPLYFKALPHILGHGGCKDIFYKVLRELSRHNSASEAVAKTVAENFNKLPENIRNELLLKLSDKKEAAWTVAKTVAENFNKLPENIRNELLLKLSDKKEAARWVVEVVAKTFDERPEDVRNKILISVYNSLYNTKKDIDETTYYNSDIFGELIAIMWVAEIITNNFNKLPDNFRNLLFKLVDKKEAAQWVAKGVADNYAKLPENVKTLLLKLVEKDASSAIAVATGIVVNYNTIPDNVRNELLYKLRKKWKISIKSQRGVRTIYKLQEPVQNELSLYLNQG